MTPEEIDEMFGHVVVPIGTIRYKVRNMLTRQQGKVLRRVEQALNRATNEIDIIRTGMGAAAPKNDNDERDRLTRVLDALEPIEEDACKECILGLNALVIDLPDALNEMSLITLSSLYREIKKKQDELMIRYMEEETKHPL